MVATRTRNGVTTEITGSVEEQRQRFLQQREAEREAENQNINNNQRSSGGPPTPKPNQSNDQFSATAPSSQLGESSAGSLIEQIAFDKNNLGQSIDTSVGALQGGVSPGAPIDLREVTLRNAGAGSILEQQNTGITGIGFGNIIRSTGAKSIGKTAVKQAAKIGNIGKVKEGITAGFKTNTKSIAQTGSYLAKAFRAAKNPKVVGAAAIGALVGAIGTYPFAGFIKEEALQTLGFATKNAIELGDEEGFRQSVELQEAILDPGVWDRIKAKIPYTNVIDSLDEFQEAANIKLEIDKKIFDDKKKQLEEGETNDQRWERVRQEQIEQEKMMIDYYNEERKKLLEWEEEAKRAQREEDARFWAAERAKQRELEAADRKAQADFWTAYRKEAQKAADNNRPSKLNFGLI